MLKDYGMGHFFFKSIRGSVKNFVSMEKNGSFLVRIKI